jgi:hypothetical protein
MFEYAVVVGHEERDAAPVDPFYNGPIVIRSSVSVQPISEIPDSLK